MIKRLIGNSLLVAAGACALTACATLTVRSDVNSALYHPGQCHTFAWAGSFSEVRSGARNTLANPVNESRLRSAIASHLQALGVRPVAANADCLVGYGIGSRVVVEDYGPYWGAGPYWGWGYGWGPYWGGWGPWGPAYPYVYHEGVIGVDLYDGRTHEALWHAQVNQNLQGATGTDAEQKINVAVSAIFAKYPG
jgi:hypothetical protein